MYKDRSFNQPTYADLRLVLKSSQGGTSTSNDDLGSGSPPAKKQRSGVSSNSVRCFCTHKVTLASASPVINTMLLRARELREQQAMGAGLSIRLVPVECSGSVGLLVSPPASQPTDLQLETLELPVEQAELLACEVLFRSIYSGDLAEEVRSALSSPQGAGRSQVKLLVRVYRLADRLEVCTEQCAQAISDLSSADCGSIEDVNCVFSLKRAAPALAEHAVVKVLMEKCLSWLVASFGLIICQLFWEKDSTMRSEFRQLNYFAVLAFFDSDDLEVDSENEILTLMGLWMGEDWADRISEEQLVAFWNVLRLGHLSTSFISNLTEIAPWLPVDPAVLRHATEWKMTKDSGDAASMQSMLQSIHGTSVGWFKDKRGHFGGEPNFTFEFSEEGLAQLLTSVHHSGAQEELHTLRALAPGHWTGTHETYNGYDFFPSLSVQLVTDGPKKSYVLSLGVDFRTSAYISKGIRTLVRVDGEIEVHGGHHEEEVGFLFGTRTWEIMRVDTLDGFNFDCLDAYRNGDWDGNLELCFGIREID